MNLKIRLRKDKLDKEGRGMIYFQYTKNSKPLKCPIGEKVEPKYWKGENGEWIKEKGVNAHPNGFQFNLLLSSEMAKAKEIILTYKLKNRNLDWESFKRTYKRGLNVKWDVVHADFIRSKKTQDKPISDSTRRMYESRRNKVIAFQSDVAIADIDETWIENFSKFLKEKKGNDLNTRAKALEYVKGVLELARKQQIIDRNPFEDFNILREINSRTNLSFKEVELLEKLHDSGFLKDAKPGVYRVLRNFLFACFTGLDYGDIATLEINHLKEIDGILVIDRIRNKSSSESVKDLPYTVPISQKARKYLPSPLPDNGLIFKVISNQKTNENIKVFVKMCSIHKKISFHCARHTFATMSLNLGVPLEILKQWMGHSSIPMTEHYAKMNKSTSAKVVSVWNDFANKKQH